MKALFTKPWWAMSDEEKEDWSKAYDQFMKDKKNRYYCQECPENRSLFSHTHYPCGERKCLVKGVKR